MLLIEYILEQPDDIVAQMNDDSIYIDNDGNMCTGSLVILQYLVTIQTKGKNQLNQLLLRNMRILELIVNYH